MKRLCSMIACIAIALLRSTLAAYSRQAGRDANAPTPAEVQAQTSAAQTKLHAYLNEIGYAQLVRRAPTVLLLHHINRNRLLAGD